MRILNKAIPLLMAVHTLAAGADQIIGSVIKKGGGPLEGVTVLLKAKKVTAVTGADGKFEFILPVEVRINASQAQTLSFHLQNNAFAFSGGIGKLSGNVKVLSANGREMASAHFAGLDPATEWITLPQLASGLNSVRVSVNNTVYTCQVLRVGSDLQLIDSRPGSPSGSGFTLSKRAASAAAVDTLIAAKTGFADARLPIASYNLSNVSIEMDSGVGSIAWGRKENPTAGACTVGALPAFSELKANPKLPDPFLMLSGARITKKSEWPCRREELYQQALHYIYGDKPIPSKGSVTGTVTSTLISVNVSEGGKSCSFTATVKMNGAVQPAPAIIGYGGGAPVPSGVATITFSAIETAGTSGAKKGPFYDFYGSNSPTGYLAAQAWQISRIIDLLEQHPEVIDPYHLGVTGCSRLGKGAFVAGMLDNRIALTLPFESGAGGTVGLRLVKQLDPTGEYAYNAIGGVSRWLSEVRLGPFATADNANGDHTDKLPIDMHEMMGLIAPRGLYIMDNPNHAVTWADENSSWVTGNVGKLIFEALGVGDNMTYESTSGAHCTWRTGYEASLTAMIDKFLLGNASAVTGKVHTEATTPPDPKKNYDWVVPVLSGEL
jgi:glucuronyl esterase-like protein